MIETTEDLRFLHFNHYPRCTARIDKHFSGYSVLQLITRGAIEVFYDDHRYVLDACRQPWFWPSFPGPRIRFHRLPDCSDWDHRYVAFRGPLVDRWMARGMFPNLPQMAPPVTNAAGQFDEILNSLSRGDQWSLLRAQNTLERILINLAESRTHTREVDPWRERVLQLLLDGDTNYGRIASRLGMGLSTMRRRFRECMGVSLHQYVVQSRVGRAKQLLGETDLPIKDVSRRLGYSDVYFFSRQFRNCVGVPPAQFRRSRQR